MANNRLRIPCLFAFMGLALSSFAVTQGAFVATRLRTFGNPQPNTYPDPFTAQPTGPRVATNNGLSHAYSFADYGNWSTSVSVYGASAPSSTFWYVWSESYSFDRLTISAPGRQGQSGLFTMGLATDTDVDFSPGSGASVGLAPSFKFIYAVGVDPDDGVPPVPPVTGTNPASNGYDVQHGGAGGDVGLLIPNVYSYSFPFTFGTSFELGILAYADAIAHGHYSGGTSIGMNLRWNGMSVKDSGGANVDMFSVASDSGFNYALSAQLPMPGDFDGDHAYECGDLELLGQGISTGGNLPAFDLNGDAAVNGQDLSQWLSVAGNANLGLGHSYLPGDANLDGVVDGSDFGIWNSHKFTSASSVCGGDFSADGVVDGTDFGIWNSHKFQSSDSQVLVPEPCFGLLVPAASILAWIVQRRKN